jgi:CHAT domain-containing protein
LAEHLQDADVILISPDGALGRFPLGALPGDDPQQYLLEERTLACVAVPQALPALLHGERRQVEGNLLALGGVKYDVDPGKLPNEPRPEPKPFGRKNAGLNVVRWEGRNKFKYRPGSASELLAIKDLYGKHFGPTGLTTLEGGRASEAALREAAPHHLYLHLATHGYFAPPQLRSALSAAPRQEFASRASLSVSTLHPGLLSGIALAGANLGANEGHDGVLSAEEVATLDLSGVDVTILSACEAGLGETAGGEGLLGLQRAFQVAGAGTVVATLWKVNDGATRDLMERFYANLWERDMGTLEALRDAQVWMLRERGPRGLDLGDDEPRRLPPKYWAAFVLSGDWR